VVVEDEAEAFEQSCDACEQYYTNRKAWQAHLKSRNHIQKSAESNSTASFASDEGPSLNTSGAEGQPADEEEKFNPKQCLFCNFESPSLDSNLTHMSHTHSFFIPDTEFLIDVESLLSYLFVIISVFHECLFCGSSKGTKFGIQDHMRGKGHCKVDFDDDEHQLKEFYDFSGDMDGNGEELEEGVTVVPDEDELRLPSGKILGHRSRVRYFRQKSSRRSSSPSTSQQQLLTEGKSETVPIESKDRRVAVRAGTSTSMIGVPELQQRALIAVEKKILRMETTARNEYQSILERGGNKQKSYRAIGIGKKQGGLEKRLG
jgi:pre-60S factor REI1